VSPEQLTREEFERVLASPRFATIHDLARSTAFTELTEGAQATQQGSGVDHTPLPSRDAGR
jgi:hypothetical protein